MFGAVIGDIVGSRFEFNNIKTKVFTLFDANCTYTDDSVLTIAVAKAILASRSDYETLSDMAISSMRTLGRKYDTKSWGRNFAKWLYSNDPEPYYSYGNGAAMRVSPAGLAAETIEEARFLSREVTRVTHNHPEGIKGAEALTVAIFMAKTGECLEEIGKAISERYYDLNFTLDGIRDGYNFQVSCQETVPQALKAFLESTGFEDAIRNAVSIGGDSDTIAAIAGAVAGVYYGVPKDLADKAATYLPEPLIKVIDDFEKAFPLIKLSS
ncbi:MAG: ADP-ribosylglycohydrolase family protein [Deltaproteobacteria bacterium]|jgi:type I restriction enzyme M protein|nr:ADP-ribosylglycohydrolase family protein [Deltaproteobacteria bacterium]